MATDNRNQNDKFNQNDKLNPNDKTAQKAPGQSQTGQRGAGGYAGMDKKPDEQNRSGQSGGQPGGAQGQKR